ncbi:MAG: glycosyltransferase family 4 protein [Hyphomonadaceae bacterium]|nr:glycosyltransferase family 4 protein [Clostridia bacterium]
MRVLIVGPSTYKKIVGGVATHVSLVKQMLESIKSVQAVETFDTTYNEHSQKISVLQSVIRIVKTRFTPYPFIYINASIYFGSLCKLALLLFKKTALNCKIVIQMHGGNLESLSVCQKWMIKMLLIPLFNKVNAIHFLTEKQQVEFTALFPMHKEKTRLTNNYVALSEQAPQKQFEHLHVLFFSRLEKDKGILEFLACANRLKDHPEISFLVAGEGSEQQTVEDFASESSNLQFFGKVFLHQKSALLQKANVFCLPSIHPEGVPYALLEAMAHGQIPVVTKAGRMGEIISKNQCGYLIEQDSEMLCQTLLKMLQNKSALTQMSRLAYETVKQQFSLQTMADAYEALLKQ